jgi:uncharacterized protein (TIGR02996 family)
MRCHPLFLPAILANPDDDGPRLVYADWLDEQGDPDLAARGEFIRLQCALARPLSEAGPRAAWHERLLELQERHEAEWRRELPKLRGVLWGLYTRGFMGSVLVQQLRALRRQAAVIFATAPVQEVGLVRLTRRECVALDGCDGLDRISRLRAVDLGITGEVLRQFLGLSTWANLRALELFNNPLGEAGVRALAEAPPPGLRSLMLGSCELRDEVVTALVGSPVCSGLERLHLNDNRVGDGAASALAAAPGSAGLRHLDLAANWVGDPGALALAGSPHLERLESLNLIANFLIGPRGRQALRARFGGRVRL